MTDTDRIAALEREVAELRAEFRQLLGLATLPMTVTGTLSPKQQFCSICGTSTMVGSWHICTPVPLNNGGTS